ncbi:MAG: DUF2147 domain-containing protein [Bdellovibrionaceae bacterium]|nr:DUF2147 domain-containing protein [Pseudobdellovibrionaceae bacterium]
MLKVIVLVSVVLLSFGVTAFASEVQENDIVGEWWSPKKDARIEIYKTENKYFGKLSWVKPGDENKLDDKNPDPQLKAQKILGLVILKDFNFKNETWLDGTIYDPKNGKTYSCKMSLEKGSPDVLKVRGFIGVSLFGRSESFERYIPTKE